MNGFPEIKIKRNWGSDIIPKEKWINPMKRYTCNGKEVVRLRIKLIPKGCTREVTYPVSGTVMIKDASKDSGSCWTLDGRFNINIDNNIYDLVEVKE